jgi:hypothetical protein
MQDSCPDLSDQVGGDFSGHKIWILVHCTPAAAYNANSGIRSCRFCGSSSDGRVWLDGTQQGERSKSEAFCYSEPDMWCVCNSKSSFLTRGLSLETIQIFTTTLSKFKKRYRQRH